MVLRLTSKLTLSEGPRLCLDHCAVSFPCAPTLFRVNDECTNLL
jgi:hypothetical protein